MISQQEAVALLRSALERRAEILDAYLFGSTARGEATVLSDVDVAVYVDRLRMAEPPSPYGYDADLATELMQALRTNRIDVTVLNEAPPVLYHRVLRDGIRLVARDLVATTVREGRALSRYCDYLPQLAKFKSAADARLRTGEFGK